MAGLRLILLGGLEAHVSGGAALAVGPRKSRALLAYLAVAGPRAHSRDTLAALLWGQVPAEQSRQSLRKALWDLRRALANATPAPLSMDRETVTLRAESDVLEFEALARDGRPDALQAARALYRGDLLDGFGVDEPAFEDWLARQRERLRQRSVEVLERLLQHGVSSGQPPEAALALQILVVNPLHEAAHRSLIRSYAEQGRRDAAIRQYRLCAEALWSELRAKPASETERLYRGVLAGPATRVAAARGRVLVVEDDVVTQTRLQDLLVGAGYGVILAADGAEALFRLGHDAIDLVLADIRMPLLDGVKLLEIVRDKRPDIPVVLVTGRGDTELEARCLALGAADYVTKPFDGPALLIRLAKALGQAQVAPVP